MCIGEETVGNGAREAQIRGRRARNAGATRQFPSHQKVENQVRRGRETYWIFFFLQRIISKKKNKKKYIDGS